MKEYIHRLGVLPFLALGLVLLVLGALAMLHVVNNFWPFAVSRLDLVRATALFRADPADMLEAAYLEIILAFLAAVMVSGTGVTLPLVYVLNRRFGRQAPHALVVLRQAMWVGIWLAFCVWLQMGRTLGVAVVLLVAGVLVLFELMLQIRTRTANV